jgi:uncharacterized protein
VRIVVDTNQWISALIAENSVVSRFIRAIGERNWDLLVCEQQFAEFRPVSRYPKVAKYYPAFRAGRLVNAFRNVGIVVDPLPPVDISPDPFDNYLLAMAQAGDADFLITGDKVDLLALGSHGRTAIVSVRQCLEGQS